MDATEIPDVSNSSMAARAIPDLSPPRQPPPWMKTASGRASAAPSGGCASHRSSTLRS